ncbi:anaerobic dehydrogenase, partial [Acinetobacter baumannii]|nr:anaerobic dehydrogenase [Acinetobacter baumannii]
MTQAEKVTELTPYLEYWSSGIYMFKCPGCKYLHPFHVKEGAHHNGSTWGFNGDIN